MKFIKFLLLVAMMVVGAAFAAINAQSVTVNYYFGTIELPLALVAAVAVGIGAVFGMLASMGGAFRLKRENARLKRQARVAEKEVSNLRNLPIKE